MSEENGKLKPFCRYCDKILSEEKGEISHGCLDCHGSAWVDRIDNAEKYIKSLKAQLAEAEGVIEFFDINYGDDYEKVKSYQTKYKEGEK